MPYFVTDQPNLMSDIRQFDYEGTPISFEFSDGNKMINATEMARPFRKQIGHFLALQGTRDYILLLESRYRNSDIGGMEVIRTHIFSPPFNPTLCNPGANLPCPTSAPGI